MSSSVFVDSDFMAELCNGTRVSSREYALFSGYHYSCSRGWNSHKETARNFWALLDKATNEYGAVGEWWHIVDLSDGVIVASSDKDEDD